MAAPAFDLRASQFCAVLGEIFSGYREPPFRIRVWHGQERDSAPGSPSRFTMVVRRPTDVGKAVLDSDMAGSRRGLSEHRVRRSIPL